VIVIVVSNSDW